MDMYSDLQGVYEIYLFFSSFLFAFSGHPLHGAREESRSLLQVIADAMIKKGASVCVTQCTAKTSDLCQAVDE